MHIAMSNTLALMSWHDIRLFLGDVTSGGSVWLLIGFLLAIVVLSALTSEAALVLHAPCRLRSRARYPVNLSESSTPQSPGQESPVGSGNLT
jgi:hypothetical protein